MAKVNQKLVDDIQTLLKQAKEAERSDVERALHLASQARGLSLEHHSAKTLAQSELRIGRCYWIKGVYDEAITYLSQALKRATPLSDEETMIEALIGLGNVYVTMEFTDTALDFYHQALSYLEETSRPEQEAKVLNNLGALHEELKHYEEALSYYQRSRQRADETGYEYGVAMADLNIGTIYLELKQYPLAFQHTMQAHEHANQHQRALLHAHCHYVLGRYYHALGAYKTSVEAFERGMEEAKKSKDFYILVRLHLSLASVLETQGALTQAQVVYEKAFQLTKQMHSEEHTLKAHYTLARFYDGHGFKEEAYEHFKAFMHTSESVQENRRLERIKNIDFQNKLKDAKEETQTFKTLSKELSENFERMKILNDIGRSMTATHDMRELFLNMYDSVIKLMPIDALVLALYSEETHALEIELNIEDRQTLEPFTLTLDNPNSMMVKSYLSQRTICLDDVEKDHANYIQKVFFSRGSPMASALYVPLLFEGQSLGVLSVQSRQKRAYQETQQLLLETLASYLAISINNAKQMKALATLNATFKRLSERDGLTGVANRRRFDAEFTRLWDQAVTEKTRIAMLFVDIDDFKEYNDAHGHLKGDDVLISVAKNLKAQLPKDAFIARYGGDEFVVIKLDLSLEDAKHVALSLKASFVGPDETPFPVTVSIGVSIIQPDNTLSKEVFLEYVDTLLYQSKHLGKDTVTAKAFVKL